jgi:hypothetical protein
METSKGAGAIAPAPPAEAAVHCLRLSPGDQDHSKFRQAHLTDGENRRDTQELT